MIYHIPVLLQEVIALLNLKPGRNVIDCTFGGGGHSKKILEKTAPNGKLLGIDADPDALKRGELLITSADSADQLQKRLILVQDNFVNIESIVNQTDFKPVNAILIDLGMSSFQLDQADRGFSFQKDSPLNMSFGKEGFGANEIINKYPKQKLKEIFQKYGEIKNASAIARKIDSARRNQLIATTSMLVKAIYPRFNIEAGNRPYKPQIKLLARVWQAIRIEVNQELDNLQKVLPQTVKILSPGGRVAIISYHSLEDRIVKQYFRQESKICVCPIEFPVCRCHHKPKLKIITKKAVIPKEEEIYQNSRARSAKLRAAEKL
ncbi:MAG: 16S rRNA (cytosine(1402)-N(4))-methyltransferase RsmH [Candidatus Jacksonbacteria bacterium]